MIVLSACIILNGQFNLHSVTADVCNS